MISIVALALLAAEPAFTANPKAIELYEKTEKELAATPDDVPTIIKAALARKMAGRYDESLELLLSCKSVKCGMMLAIATSFTDDAPRMLSFFDKWTAAKQPPEDLAAAHRFHSQALVRSGRPDEAVAAAQKAIAALDAPMMRLDLGAALFAAGKYAEAEKELDAVLAKAPRHNATLYWKYRCLKQRGDKEATKTARAAFDALVESVSDKLMDRGDLHFLLAEVATDLGEKERAQTHRAIAAKLHVTRHSASPAKK